MNLCETNPTRCTGRYSTHLRCVPVEHRSYMLGSQTLRCEAPRAARAT